MSADLLKAAVLKGENKYTYFNMAWDIAAAFFIAAGITLQLIFSANYTGAVYCTATALTAAALTVGIFFLEKRFKRGWLFYAFPLALLVIAFALLNVNLPATFNSLINGFLQSAGSAAGSIMPLLEPQSTSTLASVLFLIIVTAVITLVVSICIKNSIFLIPLVLALAVVGFSVYINKLNSLCLALVVLGLLFAFFNGKKHSTDVAVVGGRAVLGYLPFAFIATALIIVSAFNISGLQTANSTVKTAASRLVYSDTQPMPEGDFSRISDFAPTGKPTLRVVMEKPQSYYLRGYVGSTYTKSGWKPIENSTLYNSSSLFYWLHKSGFYGYNQLAVLSDNLSTKSDSNRIIINNVGTSSKYIYAPYEVKDFSGIINQSKIDDSRLIGNSIFNNSYSYTAADNLVKDSPKLISKLSDSIDESGISDYTNNEAHYNEYAYNNYLQIPQSTKNMLEGILGKYKSSNHLSYAAAKQSILNTLTSSMQYSTTVQATAEDDFVSAFLQETGEGYSVHFATAAVLMLRYYGIPARYVEGYLITPNDVEGALSNSEIIISDKNAHAWAEYYQDGVGWLPFETTPPYLDIMESADDISSISTGDSNAGDENMAGESNSNDNAENALPDSPSEQQDNNFAAVIITILIVFLVFIIIACAAVIIKRKLRLSRQLKSFRDKDINTAVLNQFNYCVQLLVKFGCIESENDIYSADEIINSDYTEQFKNAFNAYQQARFGNKELSQQQQKETAELLKSTVSYIKKNRNLFERFCDRFIKFIY